MILSLKKEAATTYLLPLLLIYGSAITSLSVENQPNWIGLVNGILPASGLVALCHLLQDVLPVSWKEFLVFGRTKERLPGHRAYSQVCSNDSRIPQTFLAAAVKSHSSSEAQQTRWYAAYLTHQHSEQVSHANLRYIAWLDATSILLMLALGTPVFGAWGIIGWPECLWVGVSCLALFFLVGTAARNSACALVCNVVALEAAPSTPT
jgi:hypothetical protein